MKHSSLILTVLAAAGLAAAAGVPAPRAPLEPAARASARELYQHVHAAHVEEDDPHAGLYTATDPHAALYAPDDPYAAAASDPHGPRARSPPCWLSFPTSPGRSNVLPIRK